ncbi:MAG: ABC transporter permease subunit [Kofleriaceae bacterium]
MTRRLALAWLGLVAAVALFADLVASDRAIIASIDGHWRWRPAAPGATLRPTLSADDWAVWPPIEADPAEVRTAGVLAPLAAPGPRHLLGTDDRGRDVAARLVHGARTSAVVAGVAALLATLAAGLIALGVALGPRSLRAVGLATLDAVASAPALVITVAAAALVGRSGLAVLAALVALPRAADTARLLTAQLDRELAAPYVAAARALGASPRRVLRRHALPALVPTLVTAGAITAAVAVLAEAALTFLGLGAPPPTSSWGELLAQATQHDLAWWLSIPAGLATTATAAALFVLALAPGRASR